MAFRKGFKREKGKKYNNKTFEAEGYKWDSKKEYYTKPDFRLP